MIMNTCTLYDTGYNLTTLVDELLKIERKISVQPSFFLGGGVMCELHHTVGKQNLVHPYIVFNQSEIILIVFY